MQVDNGINNGVSEKAGPSPVPLSSSLNVKTRQSVQNVESVSVLVTEVTPATPWTIRVA
jgi:hypothetical protein